MIRKFILLLFMCWTFAACASATDESTQLKSVINRYNQLLVQGYTALNMNPLQEVASKELAEKAYYHMAALGEGGMRMESKLKKIDFKEVTFLKPGEVYVITLETWDFSHIDIKSGEKKYEQKDFDYEVKYELNKDGTRWIIQKINAVEGNPSKRTEAPKWFSTPRPQK